jgi:hypothetical protein
MIAPGTWVRWLHLYILPTDMPLEDNESLLIHLEKLNQQQWWENVLVHHPKIDTTKIEPTNSKLSDLDGETRFVLYILQYALYLPFPQGYGRKNDGKIYLLELLNFF